MGRLDPLNHLGRATPTTLRQLPTNDLGMTGTNGSRLRVPVVPSPIGFPALTTPQNARSNRGQAQTKLHDPVLASAVLKGCGGHS